MNRHRAFLPVLAVATAVVVVLGAVGVAQRLSQAELWLQEAAHKEHVEGDLSGAIRLYERIASDREAPRAIAAQALLSLGRCHERRGSRDAQRTYERIVQQFPDQGATTAQARLRLVALGAVAEARPTAPSSVRVAGFGRLAGRNTSADGRFALVQALPDALFAVGDLRTGLVRRVPIDPHGRQELASVIAPDGRRVAYAGLIKGAADVRVANLDGTGLRVFTPARAYRGVVPVDWSRDGRQVAVLVYRDDRSGDARLASPDLAILDVSSGRFRVLDGVLDELVGAGKFLRVSTVRFAPDGASLAFVVDRRGGGPGSVFGGDIYTVKADGTGRERVVADAEPAELVGWLPDGGAIVFVSEHAGARTMFAVPIASGRAQGAPVTLLRGVASSRPLGINREGVITSVVDGRMVRAYTADLRQPSPARVPVRTSERNWVTNPVWAPDGASLAFGIVPPPGVSRSPTQLVVRNDSNEDRVLLEWQGALVSGSSWSADGRSVVIGRASGGPFHIDRVDVTTGAVETLVTVTRRVESPWLSADGRTLFVVENGSSLVRYDLNTKQPTTIARARAFAVSGDRSRIAFAGPEDDGVALKVMKADGTDVRELSKFGADEVIVSLAWAGAGEVIFAKTWVGDGPQKVDVFRIDERENKPVALGITLLSLPTLSVHPGGDRVAFVDNDWAVEFWQTSGVVDAYATAARRASVAGSR
jgi:Tol biopolymer transport system component